MSTKANEMPLASLVPGGIGGLGKGGADTHMVEAHLAVQGAIRSVHCGLYSVFSGHLDVKRVQFIDASIENFSDTIQSHLVVQNTIR